MIWSRIHPAWLVIGLMIVMTGCSPSYVPNARTSNYFSKPWEVNGGGHLGLSGLSTQMAASVSNHIFLFGTYSQSVHGPFNSRDTTLISSSYGGSFDYRFADAGAGYFLNTRDIYFEVFVGYGLGKTDAYKDPDTDPDFPKPNHPSGVINTKYNRIFIQVSGGSNTKSPVRVGPSIRLVRIDFTSLETKWDRLWFDISRPYYFLEPGLSVRIYAANLPIYWQASGGLTVPFQWKNGFEELLLDATIGVGIHLNRQRDRYTDRVPN
jgi:hypothetical protein